jgi:anion-transporting  ArsA/GET3 family ATPase
MQQVKDIHRRFMKKYDSVLQTRFVARNHLVLAENEVVQQKIANEELRRRFRESMEQQKIVKQATLQYISEAVEKLSLKSLRLKSKRRANVALLEAAQHGLTQFTSARSSLQTYENQLADYRSGFATIAQ